MTISQSIRRIGTKTGPQLRLRLASLASDRSVCCSLSHPHLTAAGSARSSPASLASTAPPPAFLRGRQKAECRKVRTSVTDSDVSVSCDGHGTERISELQLVPLSIRFILCLGFSRNPIVLVPLSLTPSRSWGLEASSVEGNGAGRGVLLGNSLLHGEFVCAFYSRGARFVRTDHCALKSYN